MASKASAVSCILVLVCSCVPVLQPKRCCRCRRRSKLHSGGRALTRVPAGRASSVTSTGSSSDCECHHSSLSVPPYHYHSPPTPFLSSSLSLSRSHLLKHHLREPPSWARCLGTWWEVLGLKQVGEWSLSVKPSAFLSYCTLVHCNELGVCCFVLCCGVVQGPGRAGTEGVHRSGSGPAHNSYPAVSAPCSAASLVNGALPFPGLPCT